MRVVNKGEWMTVGDVAEELKLPRCGCTSSFRIARVLCPPIASESARSGSVETSYTLGSMRERSSQGRAPEML
jgi:hypothetical protein